MNNGLYLYHFWIMFKVMIVDYVCTINGSLLDHIPFMMMFFRFNNHLSTGHLTRNNFARRTLQQIKGLSSDFHHNASGAKDEEVKESHG